MRSTFLFSLALITIGCRRQRLTGGRMVFHEEYSNVRVNVTLDDDLFIPEKWSTATHWYKP